jgi:hypothetical protein
MTEKFISQKTIDETREVSERNYLREKAENIESMKVTDLAFRVGIILGSIGDEDLQAWMSYQGFNEEKQLELTRLLRDLAICFYK